MKQYVIDQLREEDHQKVLQFLGDHADKTAMEGIFWLDLPRDLYTPVQAEHTDCQPYYFAVSLDFGRAAFELLVRSRQILRCGCIAYATPRQRDFLLQFADHMLEQLGIRI